MPTFVIVGANQAGGTAALTLRQEGFEGELHLLGAEPEPPYERPPLSKEYLRGEKPFEETLLRPEAVYQEEDIHLHLGQRAVRLDLSAHRVELEGGRQLAFDRLLVATGARNRRLPLPGGELAGVTDLRTRRDADRIREAAARGGRAVMVGMGFIGAEVAASLRQMGLEVSVVEMGPGPLHAALGEEVSRTLAELHAEHGVEMLFGEKIAAVEGDGRAERVRTEGGRTLQCQLVVVGVGVEPETDLLQGSAVHLQNGILVDEHCRTSVEGVFAAGDVANGFHPLFGGHIRVEHWDNALRQGRRAALSMLGRGEPQADVPWFWSDQYDLNLQYAGYHQRWDRLVLRGEPASRSFLAFYLWEGRLQAAVALDRPKELRQAMRLIRAAAALSPEELADEELDLLSLLPAEKEG